MKILLLLKLITRHNLYPMRSEYRNITSKIEATSPEEQKYREWLQFKRPPHDSAQEYVHHFKELAQRTAQRIMKEGDSVDAITDMTSQTERAYIGDLIELEKCGNDKMLARVVPGIRKAIVEKERILTSHGQLYEKVMNPEAQKTLRTLLDSLNQRLQHVDGYVPLQFEDVHIIFDTISRNAHTGNEVGGRIYESGMIKLNGDMLKKHPKMIYHQFIHEAGHLASARYMSSRKIQEGGGKTIRVAIPQQAQYA